MTLSSTSGTVVLAAEVASARHDELVQTANQEHRLALGAGYAMVEHAIRAGEALVALKAACPPGTWGAWLNENFEASDWTAKTYIKLATHQAIIRADLEQPTITGALSHLRSIPGTNLKRISDTKRAEALRLHDQGVSRAEISRRLGISPDAVRDWTDPEYNQRRRKVSPVVRLSGNRAGADQLAHAVREVMRARAAGDALALRAALRDLASCAADWAASIDVSEDSHAA